MKVLLKLLVIIFLLLSINAFPQSAIVQQIIDAVNLDTLIYNVRELSGDVPIFINGTEQTILSRHNDQPGNSLTENYITQKLQSYGLTTTTQSFSTTGNNVFSTQFGTEYPNKNYIICAHYDALNEESDTLAPGADDNASGTAAVLEAARILSQFSFPFTVVYALWDEEEQGGVGSSYYASQAFEAGDSILGVINLDMIAYDPDNYAYYIDYSDISSSFQLCNKVIETDTLYNINFHLNPINHHHNIYCCSDHVLFWQNGYGAICIREGAYNIYMHTSNDLVTLFNRKYYLDCVKLSIATFTSLALNSDIAVGVRDLNNSQLCAYKLEQNFPNPFNPSTKISWQAPIHSWQTIKVYDLLGREVKTLVNEEREAGYHSINFDASDLPSGVYFYQLKAGSFIETKKMILIK